MAEALTANGELFIGLMSGTSIDGIDAALVSFDSVNRLNVVETLFTEFSKETRNEIYHTAQNNTQLYNNDDSPLHQTLAPIYALACQNLLTKAGIPKSRISGIANHGQTVKHEPGATPPYSLQLGDGQMLANLTGIATYTQFRQADLCVGGQGAPLMPAFHHAIFKQHRDAIIVNIGGISNISCLSHTVIGFDTGPGNVLLDQWIEQERGLKYDQNGAWAALGTVNNELLRILLADAYFSASYPKSTGTDYFNLAWLKNKYPLLGNIANTDVQATLVQLTVDSICNSIIQVGLTSDASVFVCGGGAKNPLIMKGLKARLSQTSVNTTDMLGVPSDWVEAVGFAWLGYCCAHNIKSNLPSVTGANDEVVLGEAFLPQ